MKIGEEDLPHALPWDEIQPVKHDNYNPMLAKLVPELKTLSEQRRKSNKKFTLLEKDIEIYKHIKDRKSISLNENTRWAEYLKEKKLMEEQNRLVKLDEDAPKKAAGKKGKKGEDDIYLEESLNILTDYIRLMNKGNTPIAAAKTAEAIKPNATTAR